MNEGARVHDGRRAWRLLRTNPDYVTDWRANAGPVVREAPPFPLIEQTVEDLNAARWNLLAWEPPWMKLHDVPFWADVPMLEGRALDVGRPPRRRYAAWWSGPGRRSWVCGFATEDSSSR